MIAESKCVSDVMKKHFTKKLVMTKKNDKGFENSAKCVGFVIMIVLRLRYYCHIIRKYGGSAYRDCNNNIK